MHTPHSFSRSRLRRCLRPLLAGLLALGVHANAAERPNFLVILADDMGYSDVGAFGGEIATPNIDQLAKNGLRFTDFHTASTCSPTRSMLMSGTDNHIAGIANMSELLTPDQRGKPGYEGYINDRVVTVAELLRDAGYRTIISGKWHLGVEPAQDPARRGFEQSFALLQAGHNHFGKPNLPPPEMGGVSYTENGKRVELPKNFYSSDFFTDKLLEFLHSNEQAAGKDKKQPFFAYLPFSAPHWPLQAPAEIIAKYKGRYDGGWDVLRRERLERQRRLGVLPANAEMSAPSTMADWNKLSPEEKQRQSRAMEIYAAMVDRMDWNIGRVLDHLRATGQLDNTVIVFFSDNGAEGGNASHELRMILGRGLKPDPLEKMGSVDSLVSYGPNWAQAGTAPRRLYKAVTSEGGLVTPAIIRYPGFARQGGTVDAHFVTVMDLVPTFLELAGVQHPDTYQGRAVAPLRGKSLVPFLNKGAERVHDDSEATGWELFGQRALRRGSWKVTWISQPNGSGHWELYDLGKDPGERHDLTAQHPDIARDLIDRWDAYAREMGIILHEQVVSPYTSTAE